MRFAGARNRCPPGRLGGIYSPAVRRLQETVTLDATSDTDSEKELAGDPVPGLVLIFSADKPACEVIPLVDGAVELGRGEIGGDKRMSRRHARVTFDGRRFTVRDW